MTPKQVYVGVPVSALRSVSGEALDAYSKSVGACVRHFIGAVLVVLVLVVLVGLLVWLIDGDLMVCVLVCRIQAETHTHIHMYETQRAARGKSLTQRLHPLPLGLQLT